MSLVKGLRLSQLASLPALFAVSAIAVGISAAVVTASGGSLAASTKADFTLAASPASQSAAQGQVANYTVTESKLNSFSGGVTLSASNLPSGSTALFSPQVLDTKTSANLAITIGTATPVATYTNITITGTGGGVTHTANVTLTVTQAPSQTFSMSASPTSATMLPGGTATYTLATSGSSSAPIQFSVAGVPTGSTSTFSPPVVSSGGSSLLQVATKNNSAGGTYTLTITGTSGARTQSAVVTLVLSTTGKQFTITAPAVNLPGPGGSRALNLSITNTENQPLQVTNLSVAIQSVAKATAAPAGSCTAADYAVTQFTGNYPLVIGAGQTVALSTLAPSSAWPKLEMLDSNAPQDGCKGAVVKLALSGSGQG